MSRHIIIGIVLLLVFIAGFYIFRAMQGDSFKLPKGEAQKEVIVVQDGEVLGLEEEVNMEDRMHRRL